MTIRATLLDVGGAVPSGVASARQAWTERHSVVVRLEDEPGQVGLGEASPLPRHSTETLDEARRALEAVRWDAFDLDASADTLLDQVIAGVPDVASARFAAETALLDLAARRRSVPIHRLFGRDAAPVPLSALLASTDEASLLAEADAAIARGIRTLKRKVGRDLARELDELLALRARIGPDIAIRLDANQSLPPASARAWLESLGVVAPALIEEPVPPEVLAREAPLSVPVALDESLLRPDGLRIADDFLGSGRAYALVAKPMLLGGFGRTLAVGALANAHEAPVIVTHLFDGPVARAAAAELTLVLRMRGVALLAAGLDVHPALAAFPAAPCAAIGASEVRRHERPGLGLEGAFP